MVLFFSFHLHLHVRVTKIPSLHFTFKHIVFPLGSHPKSVYCRAYTLVRAEKVKEQSHFPLLEAVPSLKTHSKTHSLLKSPL